MHRYFYDWEFQEQQDSETGLTTIFPISLGMVGDDGRELYLVNKTYSAWEEKGLVRTSQWVKDNVLNYITDKDKEQCGYEFEEFGAIIQNFIEDTFEGRVTDRRYVELWGYFSAYDHVCLAQCFGSMMQLPDSIPMHTKDLKQLVGKERIRFNPENEHHALSDARWNRKVWDIYGKHTR